MFNDRCFQLSNWTSGQKLSQPMPFYRHPILKTKVAFQFWFVLSVEFNQHCRSDCLFYPFPQTLFEKFPH